jgi:hypothetical protein
MTLTLPSLGRYVNLINFFEKKKLPILNLKVHTHTHIYTDTHTYTYTHIHTPRHPDTHTHKLTGTSLKAN